MTKEAKLKKIIENEGAKLQKVINKAVKGGWVQPENMLMFNENILTTNFVDGPFWFFNDVEAWYSILFQHSFAKAIWGEEIEWEEWARPKEESLWDGHECEFIGKRWQFYLQQAVISDDPISYYYKNM